MTQSKQIEFPAVSLSIPYPESSNRLTTFFRLILVLPIFLILVLLSGDIAKDTMIISGGLFLPTVLTILFRKKYPKAWFDWLYYLSKLCTRITAYILLLRDEYPALDQDQSVDLQLRYPDAEKELHRALPLIKWLLAIPHYIVLFCLSIATILVTIFAWFAILITGKYPKGCHQFIVGVIRWFLRVNTYAVWLITDQYPPFHF